MGEVWLAEQLQPVRRQLAVKLIKAGMDTRQVIARFEAERQALALMGHPGIAKVFDAGSTPEGRPYFAMEYVRGEPITAYCARGRLDLRARLSLFLEVCDAVQHAHQKGIIHRDLKPSNVLVAEIDGKPRPTIIDFGIAKATSQPLTEHTLHTELGSVIGTPEYMSPEQAELSGRDVDTRTDVYALGAILYELLTGVLPLDIRGARQSGIDEVRRTIRDVQPPRPSTRGSARAAAIRGDLDWITMKALEKERARRYGSVSELAADIRRHLVHQPVLAGPPTTGYRAAKFLRRHRLGASIAAATIVLVVGFAVVMAVQARRIATERDRANLEAQAARQTAAFLSDLFTVSDPSESRGNTLTATEILDKGAAEIDRTLKNQPELRARLQMTIGGVYTSLGRYSAAEPLLTTAAATLRSTSGADALDTLTALAALAELYWNQQRLTDAEALYAEVVTGRTRRLGPDHRDTLKAQYDLASTYITQRQLDKALALTQDVLQRQRRTLGTSDRDTVESLGNLSAIYYYRERYTEALSAAKQVEELRRQLLGASHPDTLDAAHNVATILSRLGRIDEAAAIQRDALLTMQRVQGSGNPSTTASQVTYANMLRKLRRFPEAETQLLEALGALTAAGHGTPAPSTQQVITELVALYTDWGKPEKTAEWRAKLASPPAR